MRSAFIAVAALFLLTGCEVRKAATDAPVAAVDESEAQKAVTAAHAALVGGDAQAVANLYAPGATVFDSSHNDPTADRALQTRWAADFVLMKPADLVTKPVIQPIADDAFIASGIMAFTADVGGQRRLLHARYSQLFRKEPDGRWLIVHEHMSSPPEAQLP